MSNKGRKVPKLAVIDGHEPRRPGPPTGVSPAARRIWTRIVAAYEPTHFTPQCLDLLRIYCEDAAAHKVLMKKYIDSDYEDVKYLRAADKMAARCQGICTKLCLNLNNRMVHRGKGASAPKPKTGREHLLFGGKDRKK